MNTVNLGIVSPVPMGDWNSTTTYQKLNIVRTETGCYIARSQSTNIQPGVDASWQTYWMLLNVDGEEGPTGSQGPVGEGVPTGGLTGQVLAKSSNNNYETEWLPQNQIAAGSAVNDGNGNNIADTYETKQHASQTYETKSDAATKNSNLQLQITQNQNSISSNAEQISEIQNSVSQNSALISRNAKRLDGLEQRIKPSPFVTDSTIAYQKDVPSTAVGAVEIQILGGMTYKTTNLIKTPYVESSKTENGITWTVNSDGSVSASGTSTAGSAFVLCNSVSFGSSDVNALTSNVTSGPYAFGNCAYNGTTQAVYLSVGVGETVSKTFYPIINLGASVAPYEPYFDGLRDSKVTEVKSVGANLLNIAENTQIVGLITLNVNLPAGEYSISCGGGTWGSKGYGSIRFANNEIFVGLYPEERAGTITLTKQETTIYIYSNGTTWSDSNGVTATLKWLMLNKGATALPYTPYQEHIFPIPTAVQALNGYGQGNPDDTSEYNAIVWDENGNASYQQKGNITDGVWVTLATTEVTDISDLITLDNLLSIQGNGTLTFENEYGFAVPSTVEYITDEITA